MAIKIIDPFTNIELTPIPTADNSNDPIFLSNLQAINVGQGGTNTFRADKTGIWLGAEKAADAPFYVSMSGNLKTSGFILVGGAAQDIIDHNKQIGAANLNSTVISGGKIITGLLTADNIQTGTLTGRTVQTSTSGQRVVIDSSNDYIKFYDGDGILAGTISGAPTYGIYVDGDFYINGMLQGISNLYANRIYVNAGSGTGIEPTWNNSVTCGSSSYRWSNVYSVDGNFSGDILCRTISNSTKNGSYLTGNWTSCPLPISKTSALEKIGNPVYKNITEIKKTKTYQDHLSEYQKDKKLGIDRMYIDIEDTPKECHIITPNGEEDIELSRTVGFLYQCVIELNNKIKELNNKIKELKIGIN